MVTARKVAQLFRVAVRTVRSWHTELGMPKAGADRYDLRIVIQWRLGQETRELEARRPEILRYKVALAEAKEKQTGILDRKLRRLDNDLIERAGVEAGWLERIYAVKTALSYLDLILGRRLSGVSETAEIETIVAEEVEQILRTFATPNEEWVAGQMLAKRIARRIKKAKCKIKNEEEIEKLLGDDPWSPAGDKEN